MRSTPDETISAARLPPTASTEPDPAPTAERGVGCFASGEIIAERYQVVRAVGSGGMGEVYEAVDRELGQTVAIKLLRPEIAQSATARERMLDELRLARRIAHPAVCRVFDIFRHSTTGSAGAEGLLGIAMEYLPGESLAARLGRPFARAEAERWLADVADALTAAHACGVVHLDLKPGNVLMVDRGGETRAVLADFGVSRAVAEAGGRTAGATPGTPDFIAPEIARGEPAAPAADVYSLGVLLERVAGAAALATADARSGWTPRQLRAWRRIAAACRSEDPPRRPASPARVARDLSSKRRRRVILRLALASAATVSLAVASYGSWVRSHRDASFQSTIRIAEEALADRRIELARQECDGARRAAADRQSELRAQACIEEANGELESAARDYRALWALDSRDMELAIALARIEGRLGRGRQALAVLDEVTRRVSAASETRFALAEAEAAGVARALTRQTEAARRAREHSGGGDGRDAAWADLLLAEASVRLGRFEEAGELLDPLTRSFQALNDRHGAIRLELVRCEVLRGHGQRDDAARHYQTATEAAGRAGFRDLQARALRGAARNDRQRGRLEDAVAEAEQALAVARRADGPFQVALSQSFLGRFVYDGGDIAEARLLIEAAFATLDRLGADAAADDVGYLAQIDWRQGRLADARKRLVTAAGLLRRGGDVMAEVGILGTLAWVELEAGDVAAADATVAAAAASTSAVPSVGTRFYILSTQAMVRYEQDALAEARDLCRIASELGSGPSQRDLSMLRGIQASIAGAEGDAKEHLRLAKAALAAAQEAAWPENIALESARLAGLLVQRGELLAARAHLAISRAQAVRDAPRHDLILGWNEARVRAAEGDIAGALVDLEHLRRRSAEASFELLQGEIELTLGELLHVSGRMADAGEVAESLIERASRRGQVRLARLASEQRDRLREAAKEPTSTTRERRRRPPPARPAASS